MIALEPHDTLLDCPRRNKETTHSYVIDLESQTGGETHRLIDLEPLGYSAGLQSSMNGNVSRETVYPRQHSTLLGYSAGLQSSMNGNVSIESVYTRYHSTHRGYSAGLQSSMNGNVSIELVNCASIVHTQATLLDLRRDHVSYLSSEYASRNPCMCLCGGTPLYA